MNGHHRTADARLPAGHSSRPHPCQAGTTSTATRSSPATNIRNRSPRATPDLVRGLLYLCMNQPRGIMHIILVISTATLTVLPLLAGLAYRDRVRSLLAPRS